MPARSATGWGTVIHLDIYPGQVIIMGHNAIMGRVMVTRVVISMDIRTDTGMGNSMDVNIIANIMGVITEMMACPSPAFPGTAF